MAKRAISQGSSIESRLPRCLRKKIPVNRQAVAQRIHVSLKQQATQLWNASPRAERLQKIDKSLPSDSYLKLIAGLPRNRAAMLTQLQTGHIPLQAYLHRIQVTNSATCLGCKREHETVMHFLMQCPSWAAQRRLLVTEAGPAARSIGKLLNQKAMLPHLFRYIDRTGRFTRVNGAGEGRARRA
jgi:hypothetical protein